MVASRVVKWADQKAWSLVEKRGASMAGQMVAWKVLRLAERKVGQRVAC